MNLIMRTANNSYLQTTLLLNTPFVMNPNTTLNELYGIQTGITPLRTPTLGYFAIGNGGHQMTIGADGIPLTNPVQHSAEDSALYNGLPFILRPINNDIDTISQTKYALRRIETHSGNQYIAYYLKRLQLTTVTPTLEATTVTNNVSSTVPFTSTSANLNPTPPALSNTGINLVSGDYISATAEIDISLSASDVTELLNVANIIYGDPNYAIISEIALCSGVDKVVQSATYNNAQIPFNEAIAVQCLSFINCMFALAFNSSGVDLLLNCGATEPLFTLS